MVKGCDTCKDYAEGKGCKFARNNRELCKLCYYWDLEELEQPCFRCNGMNYYDEDEVYGECYFIKKGKWCAF